MNSVKNVLMLSTETLPEDKVDKFYETAMLARRQRSTPSFICGENCPKTLLVCLLIVTTLIVS